MATETGIDKRLREATPWGDGPRFLVRDHDNKFGKRFAAVAEGTGIEGERIPPRSPNLNPSCERFLGSVRRECLDHVVILSQRYVGQIIPLAFLAPNIMTAIIRGRVPAARSLAA